MWGYMSVRTMVMPFMVMSFMVMMVFITTGSQDEIRCKN